MGTLTCSNCGPVESIEFPMDWSNCGNYIRFGRSSITLTFADGKFYVKDEEVIRVTNLLKEEYKGICPAYVIQDCLDWANTLLSEGEEFPCPCGCGNLCDSMEDE